MDSLFEEEPFAAVVAEKYFTQTCSHCFKTAEHGLTPCSKCKVLYYCDAVCMNADWNGHHQRECVNLKRWSETTTIPLKAIYRLLSRVLLKLEDYVKNGKVFEALNKRTWDDLCDHTDARRKRNREGTESDISMISQLLAKFWNAPLNQRQMENIGRAFSKMSDNAFSINANFPVQHIRGHGLYIGLSIHDHSCAPDAYVIFNGAKAILRSTNEDVKNKDPKEITVSYLSGNPQSKDSRQDVLRQHYMFQCNCSECSEPTLPVVSKKQEDIFDSLLSQLAKMETVDPNVLKTLQDYESSMVNNSVPYSEYLCACFVASVKGSHDITTKKKTLKKAKEAVCITHGNDHPLTKILNKVNVKKPNTFTPFRSTI